MLLPCCRTDCSSGAAIRESLVDRTVALRWPRGVILSWVLVRGPAAANGDWVSGRYRTCPKLRTHACACGTSLFGVPVWAATRETIAAGADQAPTSRRLAFQSRPLTLRPSQVSKPSSDAPNSSAAVGCRCAASHGGWRSAATDRAPLRAGIRKRSPGITKRNWKGSLGAILFTIRPIGHWG